MIRTLTRRFALMFGLLLGALTSQLPEYAQQYRQRLGGALDELTRQVAEFNMQAASQGLQADAAIGRLEGNSDALARQRGSAMRDAIARRDRLAGQKESFADAGAFGRVFLLARDFDPGIARGAWAMFEPAVPLTREGAVCGALGLAVGYGAWRLAGSLFSRRKGRDGKPAPA